MLTKCFILWIGYFVTSSEAGYAAAWLKPCAPLDSACITNSATFALPYFGKGINELGVPAMDPLPIKDTKAESGELKVDFKNVKVHQLSECKFESITRDPVESTARIIVTCPLIIKGDYSIDGKVFFLDIDGTGGFTIGGGDMRMSVDLKLKTIKDKEDKKHYKVGSFDYTFEPLTQFKIHFDNLCNGDKEKADPILKVVNEGWKELILDLGKPLVKEGIVSVANIIDKMFKKVPAEDLEIA